MRRGLIPQQTMHARPPVGGLGVQHLAPTWDCGLQLGSARNDPEPFTAEAGRAVQQALPVSTIPRTPSSGPRLAAAEVWPPARARNTSRLRTGIGTSPRSVRSLPVRSGRSQHVVQWADDVLAETVHEGDGIAGERHHVNLVDADFGVRPECLGERRTAGGCDLQRTGPQDRLADGVEVGAQARAVRSQNLELRADLVRPGARAAGKQVAGVGVLRDQPQGLLLPTPRRS